MIFLLALVLASPLPYGAVLPGGKLLIEICAFAAAFFALTARTSQRLGKMWIAVAAVSLVVALGLLQLAPLPAGVVEAISPRSAEVHQDLRAVLPLFGHQDIPAPRVSIAPADTAATAVLVLSWAALFVAAARAASTRLRRRLLGGALLLNGFVQIGIALAEGERGRLSGSFINPNHLAGYLTMSVSIAFALVWYQILRIPDRAHRHREPLERFQSSYFPVAWSVVLWVAIAAGLILTQSRGGIIASAVAWLLMLCLALLHGRSRRAGRIIAAGVATAAIAGPALVAVAVGKYPLLRFLATDPRDPEADLRFQLWTVSLAAWKEFPWLGSGLGSFREAFRRVQPADLTLLVEQAHSDPLQILVTGGLLGFLLAFTAAFTLLALFVLQWKRQSRREESSWGLAAIGALVALLLHGLVEFNFSIPAIPATLAVMLGCAWRAVSSHDQVRAGEDDPGGTIPARVLEEPG